MAQLHVVDLKRGSHYTRSHDQTQDCNYVRSHWLKLKRSIERSNRKLPNHFGMISSPLQKRSVSTRTGLFPPFAVNFTVNLIFKLCIGTENVVKRLWVLTVNSVFANEPITSCQGLFCPSGQRLNPF